MLLREVQQRFAQLTEREREVMALVIAGRPNKQIAAELGLSDVTVKVHGQIMRKMRRGLVAGAGTHGRPPRRLVPQVVAEPYQRIFAAIPMVGAVFRACTPALCTCNGREPTPAPSVGRIGSMERDDAASLRST